MAALRQLANIPVKYPFTFGVVLSTAKTSVSDLVVQKVVQQKEEIDWKRNLAFASFGCFYLGGVQYLLYVPVFGRLFPNAAAFSAKRFREKLKDTKGLLALTAQVFLDQFVHHPLLYFPVFYCTKEFVVSETPSVSNALSQYKENMTEDLKALWKIWVPSSFINFAFMPMWGRIPWVAGTSFLWSMILSVMRGGNITDGDELAGGNTLTGEALTMFEDSMKDLIAVPVDFDQTLAHACVSASGPDKVGWVHLVTRAVADLGGNVTHSKMLRMGSEFTILMHVEIPPSQFRGLVLKLQNNEELKPLNIRCSGLTRRETGMFIVPTFALKIHCVGKDRPGILAEISESLAEQGMAVENLTTELRRGENDERYFVVDAEVTITNISEINELKPVLDDIKQLKNELELDILDLRVQKLRSIA